MLPAFGDVRNTNISVLLSTLPCMRIFTPYESGKKKRGYTARQTNKTHFVHYFRNYCIHNILLSLSLLASMPLTHPISSLSAHSLQIQARNIGWVYKWRGQNHPQLCSYSVILEEEKKRCYFLFPTCPSPRWELAIMVLCLCSNPVPLLVRVVPTWINLKVSIFSHFVLFKIVLKRIVETSPTHATFPGRNEKCNERGTVLFHAGTVEPELRGPPPPPPRALERREEESPCCALC